MGPVGVSRAGGVPEEDGEEIYRFVEEARRDGGGWGERGRERECNGPLNVCLSLNGIQV